MDFWLELLGDASGSWRRSWGEVGVVCRGGVGLGVYLDLPITHDKGDTLHFGFKGYYNWYLGCLGQGLVVRVWGLRFHEGLTART